MEVCTVTSTSFIPKNLRFIPPKHQFVASIFHLNQGCLTFKARNTQLAMDVVQFKKETQ